MKIKTIKQLLRIIKKDERYAWPGGYPMYIFDSDGVLCWDCVKEHCIKHSLAKTVSSRGDVHWEVFYEGTEYCSNCYKHLETAYGEIEEEEAVA